MATTTYKEITDRKINVYVDGNRVGWIWRVAVAHPRGGEIANYAYYGFRQPECIGIETDLAVLKERIEKTFREGVRSNQS